MSDQNLIKNGQYVVFQRKEYKKLHMLSEKNSFVFIGKDKIELNEVFGKQLGSMFKIVPIKGSNRSFSLKLCSLIDISSPKEIIKEVGSGIDNRNIHDDGSSQLLTSDSIEELRDSGTTPKSIIEQLVENSKTFQIKTEYSQEKYINKKEKKYFEFITVCKPSIRLLAHIFYSRDLPKLIGIRIDSLSQIITAVNFQSDGTYLLVENGFNGIVSATLLNCLSDTGKIVLVTPGNQNQKQAILAMNFSKERLSQLLTVRFSTLKDLTKHSSEQDGTDNSVQNYSNHIPSQSQSTTSPKTELNDLNCSSCQTDNQETTSAIPEIRKRKSENCPQEDSGRELKKPRWEIEAELALEVISQKVDGLVIACKEFPLNILTELLQYLSPSRPFVIYSLYQEALVNLYLVLKKRHDIIYLRIMETWLRPYQVLDNRTHPAVTITSTSGYLLTGLRVVNK